MSAKEDKHCGILDGSIAYGLTDKWSNEDKRKFTEGRLDDSFLFDSNEIPEISVSRIRVQRKKLRKIEPLLSITSHDSCFDVSQNATATSVQENSVEENGLGQCSVDKTGEDSEVNISTTAVKRKKKKKLFLDSDSQENDSEGCQATETSSMYQSSEISTAEDLRRVIIPDSQSSQGVDSDSEQIYSMSSRTSGLDDEPGDDGDDKDIDSCSTSSEPGYANMEFKAYLQYMLSFCLDSEFLDHTSNQDTFNIAKKKIETKIEDLEHMLKSQAWQTGFREAMEAFPILQLERLDLLHKPCCEACARPGRIASKIFTFMGPPYDIEDFESQETSSPSQISFRVGRYCARRSELYHRVFHYRFHLREKCVEAINQFSENDHATSDFVLNQCLDDEQWIKKEYRNFCSLIDSVTTWFANVNKSENPKCN